MTLWAPGDSECPRWQSEGQANLPYHSIRLSDVDWGYSLSETNKEWVSVDLPPGSNWRTKIGMGALRSPKGPRLTKSGLTKGQSWMEEFCQQLQKEGKPPLSPYFSLTQNQSLWEVDVGRAEMEYGLDQCCQRDLLERKRKKKKKAHSKFQASSSMTIRKFFILKIDSCLLAQFKKKSLESGYLKVTCSSEIWKRPNGC